jgi:hypothetical protein
MGAYPVVEDSKRPFRLYDPIKKVNLRWRCYRYHRNAVIGALIEVKWAKVGTTIEVIDVRYGQLIGQYTRTATSVEFYKEKGNVKD